MFRPVTRYRKEMLLLYACVESKELVRLMSTTVIVNTSTFTVPLSPPVSWILT